MKMRCGLGGGGSGGKQIISRLCHKTLLSKRITLVNNFAVISLIKTKGNMIYMIEKLIAPSVEHSELFLLL